VTTSPPRSPERVAVAVKGGATRLGVVRERWQGLAGRCVVVDFADGDWIIAPAATVRPLNESELTP
jgi:hypothetical protein